MFFMLSILMFTACTNTKPQYISVQMKDWGKNGKSDFTIQTGQVATWMPGTELYQIPLWEQRGTFEKELHLKSADNTEFISRPVYSFKVIKERAIDVVFENKQLEGDFMVALQDNILETKVYDLMKEESRKYVTDTLMANGGSLRFEERIQEIVRQEFNKKGIELLNFSCQLDFSDKVKAKIDTRNETNTNISLIDQQIIEQRKKNELAELQTQEMLIRARGLTSQLLQQQFIEKWDGHTAIYGMSLPFIKTL